MGFFYLKNYTKEMRKELYYKNVETWWILWYYFLQREKNDIKYISGG